LVPGVERPTTLGSTLENRRAILTAAREVFAEVGYEAASVRDIIGRTGLASGTFYNYYRSKEEIGRAIASDAAERLAYSAGVSRRGERFAGYLIGVIRVYFQFIVDEQLALRTTRQLAERYPRVRIQTPAAAAVFEEVRSSIEFVMQRDLGLRTRRGTDGLHDSPLEETGFEPSVPLLRKGLSAVTERRSPER
jgi:AcrR family transcriptional regulator